MFFFKLTLVVSNRGIRQACILSLALFALYTVELKVFVKESFEIKVVSNRLSMFMHANEIIVM